MRFFIFLSSLALCLSSHAKDKPTPFAKAASKGFAIPQIDLSDRADLQTVISRDPVVYMGHPSSVLLDDHKTMLMFYLNKHGRGDLMWRRSTDAGKTWSDDLPLPEGWGGTLTIDGQEHSQFLEVPIVYKVDGPDGIQRLVLYTSGRDIHPARYTVSEDGGNTWSQLQPILAGGKTIDLSIVLFSDMVKLNNGHYLFTYHEPGRVFTTSSADGITFDKPKLAAAYPEAFLCEACFVRSPDGKTLALLMRENNRVFNSFIAFSKDEGETWSEPRQMPDALTGDRHQHTYTLDGRLFISFRDRGAASPTEGDWVGWVGTFDDLVAGTEGQYRVRLKDNFKGHDCAYPSQHRLPDGTIFAATYGGWEEGSPNYLIAFHLLVEELDTLAAKEYPEKVVVFESNDTNGFRIPALVTANNGDLLAFCERRVGLADHAQNDIVLRRSTDSGSTWTPLQLIADEGGDSLNDPSAIVLDSGEILLIYQQFPEGYHSVTNKHMTMCDRGYDGPRNSRTLLRRSTDHGATWSDAEDITRSVRRPEAVNIASPGRGIQLQRGEHKGRLLYPVYENHSSEKERIWNTSALISDDLGKTWRAGSMVPPDNGPGFGNENQIVELADGTILMSSRNQSGKAMRRLTLSHNGGETWEPYRFAEDLVTPQCMASVIRDGDILIHSLPYSTKNRKNGVLFASRDGGKTWPIKRQLEPESFAYSSLTLLKDGTIGCLYESTGYRQTLFTRFPLTWVLANSDR